jgi:hypothetical protein
MPHGDPHETLGHPSKAGFVVMMIEVIEVRS